MGVRVAVMMRWAAPTALVALLAASPSAADHAIGVWGGPHIGANFEGGLADVQFDCASGTIDDPVYPARDGSFAAKGTYRTGAPGPIKVGEFFKSEDATFSGRIVRGAARKGPRVMTLSIVLEDGKTLGPFTLTEGEPPQLTRCA